MTAQSCAKLIATLFTVEDDCRATANGLTVRIEKNTGGKRGWIPAGEIKIDPDTGVPEYTDEAKTRFELRLILRSDSPVWAQVSQMRAEVVAPAAVVGPDLAQAANDFRAGKHIPEDLIVECVQRGYLTVSEAMNRDA